MQTAYAAARDSGVLLFHAHLSTSADHVALRDGMAMTGELLGLVSTLRIAPCMCISVLIYSVSQGGIYAAPEAMR